MKSSVEDDDQQGDEEKQYNESSVGSSEAADTEILTRRSHPMIKRLLRTPSINVVD